jgi:hypothetical protein
MAIGIALVFADVTVSFYRNTTQSLPQTPGQAPQKALEDVCANSSLIVTSAHTQ